MVAFKTLVFTIVVPGTIGGLFPWLLAQGAQGEPGRTLQWTSVWTVVALLLLALGVGVYLWCAGAFTFIGKGTPAPIDPPKTLVVQGPYRWVRNPIYLAVTTVILGQALLFRAPVLVGYAIVWVVFVHTVVVFVEEPSLREQFDGSYEEYLRRVPRWIPRPRSRSRPAS